jgi:hemolysin activation/secretion protein
LFLLSAVITQSQALAANVTPAQVERSEQLIDQQGLLRQRLEKGAKVFVKEIEVTGASLIKTEDIKELIKPLEKSWVYKSDIQTVIESIKELYNKSGYEKRLKNITYQIKDGLLKIQIEEQNPLTK